MSYPNFTKSCRQTKSKLIVTVLVINSHQSFRHVNMTTLLSRTAVRAVTKRPSFSMYSPGNDLQLDLEGPATYGTTGYYTAGAALDSLPSFMYVCC